MAQKGSGRLFAPSWPCGQFPPKGIFTKMNDGFEIGSIPAARPVLIAGPTASGKSALAAAIVAQGGGVIVNADALQVYGCWRVLTARPSIAEARALPHALYGHVGAGDDYSVGHWLREVQGEIAQGLRPVIVGGTGLYFSALTDGLAQIPATPAAVRAVADARMAAEGVAGLLAELDAATTARIDIQNPARVQRAWEVLTATGRGLAAWQDQTGPAVLPLDAVTAIVLRPQVDWLNARIDQRFDTMMAEGALEEARANLADWVPTRASSRAIGAPELIAHLRGDLDLDAAVAQAKLASRQYAKRQRTWLRNRMKGWIPLDPGV
ncbi:tRNA dimethylallyltransferase [Pseudorhodobacter antarcticus]|uniref:tRNA dimethylallyltransferase n=2 Tax=Pseudorhodobacter antarcticus TaxID=1077947 RepID=A0A1H8DSL8_9RHOB|nr:tRNA dimethylallyltransferase [Pseudorhodobacter antarcticus]